MPYTFWSFAQLLHLVGLTLIAGGTISGVVLHRAIGRDLADAPTQAAAAARIGHYFSRMTQTGALVMLLSGVGLLASRQWIYVGQPWLAVKLGLYALLWLNGLLLARPAARQFSRLLPQWLAIQGLLPVVAAPEGTMTSSRAEVAAALARSRRRLAIFHTNQALGLALMLVLAVFKFH